MSTVVEVQVGDARCAIPLARVIEIALRVRLTPLPGVNAPVSGYLGYRGAAIPAVDLRQRLGAPAAVRMEDHLVIARAARRPVALVVDRVVGVREIDAAAAVPPPASSIAVAGLLAVAGGLLLIADLDRVLSLEEERAIEDALEALSP
jgi:purine-binding chemotaxis protein CheW